MNIFVINLRRRKDRLDMMNIQLRDFSFKVIEAVDGSERIQQSYTPFADWIDPLVGRTLTLGEIATSLSHINAWKAVKDSNEPAIILEDDCELVQDLNIGDIKSHLTDCDMLYLGYKEMHTELVQDINSTVNKPYYPYHAHSYAITPEFAGKLIDLHLEDNVIPVDELFPILNRVDYNKHCLSSNQQVKRNFLKLSNIFKLDDIKIHSLKVPVFNQYPRVVFGSDIESAPQLSSNYTVLTVGTDTGKMDALLTTLSISNAAIINLGEGKTWNGGDMGAGAGGGQKINLVKEYLKSASDNQIILFLDGYDVMAFNHHEKALTRFRENDLDILFAAEKTCWPDESIASQFTGSSAYKYLNSGCYVGYAWAIKEFLSAHIEDQKDDQLYMQKQFLSNTKLRLGLDSRNEIFCCLNGTEDYLETNFSKKLINRETNTDPIYLHGNGGVTQKNIFNNVFIDTFVSNAIEFADTEKMDVVGSEILSSTFLTEKDCRYIIRKAELNSQWKSLPGDKFPGQEMRLKDLDEDLYNKLVHRFEEVVVPVAEKYWFPIQYYGIRDMFIIKYSPSSQISLPCHHDASLFSGSIKLNEDYEGAELNFYRQKFNNANVSAGDIIVWPGQVTHGHECTPLIRGTKYSLTIWTSRYSGDIN